MSEKTTPREQAYLAGRRAALMSIMAQCAQELGYDDPAAKTVALISQLEQTRTVLRDLCEHYGDLDWDDSLHLADVAEKHLGRHLDEGARRRGEPRR